MSEHQQPLLGLFVFLGLALGGILRQISKKTNFPYAPMLILFGILLGCYRDNLGIIGESAELMSRINPHMILFIFIPVLIFESGFNCDWYVFKRALLNIIILATPGVLVGSVLLGFCLKKILGYQEDLNWSGAFTMGAILCATDPVAIVGLLKELGASVRFNTLIEGEALLNDGTAMVFFQVFFNLEKGLENSSKSVIVHFFQLAGGGVTVGFFVGIIGSFWLQKLVRDDVLASTITFITCYICFYIAEFTFLKVSGILALVILGLFMSANGRVKICAESEHSVHTVWSFVQYGCETLIFLLTGVMVGKEMISQDSITLNDWLKLPIFWCLMIIARAIMIFLFLPFLKYFGYGINKAELIVLIWGGLRGALGLTLALMVAVDSDLLDEEKYPLGKRLRQLTIFYMSGIATLTILINGTTCRYLVSYLKMIDIPKIHRRIIQNSIRNLSNECDEKKKELQMNKFLQMADWQKIEEIAGLDKIKEYAIAGSSIGFEPSRKSSYSSFDDSEICSETRFRFLRTLKTYLWKGYQNGQMGPVAVQLLNECVNVSLDKISEPIIIWDTIYSNFTDFGIRLSLKMKDWYIVGGFAKNYITHHLAFIYEVTTGFISSTEEAEELLQNFPIGNEYIVKINKELKKEVYEAFKYISDLQSNFPEIVKAIHTKRAAYSLLETQKRFLKDHVEKGFIDEVDYNHIQKDIDCRVMELENISLSWQDVSELLSFDTFVLKFPIFSSLTSSEIKELEMSYKSFNYLYGAEIYHYQYQFNYLFIIISGTVTDVITSSNNTQYTMIKGMGSFLSFANCVNEKNNKSISTATAQTDAILYGIPFEVIKGIMARNKTFEKRVYLYSIIYFIRLYPDQAGPLKGMEENHLNEYIFKSQFLCLYQGDECSLENGGYLIVGQIEEKENKISWNDFSFIEASQYEYIITENSYLLKFDELLKRKLSIMDNSFEEQGMLKFNQNRKQESKSYMKN